MVDPLERLEELIRDLPPLTSLIRTRIATDYVEYGVEGGTCLAWPLINIPEGAAQRTFISKGSTFVTHFHNVNEFIIVTKGKVQASLDGQLMRVVHVGECQLIPARISHTLHALEDTWFIGVTVPAAKGYPDDSAQ